MNLRPYVCLIGFTLMLVNIAQGGIHSTILILHTPSKQVSSQQTEDQPNASQYPSDISPFIQQADKLFNEFDKNKDQKLDKDEFSSLSKPPSNADSNDDGLVDKVELIKALILAQSETKTEPSKPTSPILQQKEQVDSSTTNRTPRINNRGSEIYNRYADGLFQSYDLNKDEKLDQNEMKSMRKPPQNADENGDGYVDRSELIAYVAQRVSQPNRQPRTPEGDKLEALLLKKIEERKRALAAKRTTTEQKVIPPKLKTPQKPAFAANTQEKQSGSMGVRLRSLRTKRRDVLKQMTEMLIRQYETGSASLEEIFEAQSRLLEAELELASNRIQRIEIHKEHVQTKKKFAELSKRLMNEGLISGVKVLSAEAELLDSEIRLAEEQNRMSGNEKP